MNRSAGKNHQLCGIDHQVWCRLFRGVHPAKTAQRVAADIGASARTVENWMSGVSAPSLGWFVRLLTVYGPAVLAEVMPASCGWMSDLVRAERIASIEAEQVRLAAELRDLGVQS